MTAWLIWAALWGGMFVQSVELPPAAARRIEFATEVAPLLQSRCLGCHGATLQMHGLRLDGRADALRGGESGPVILPGNSRDSKLIRMVAGSSGKFMPPAGERLSAADVGILRAWIDQGAEWSEPGAAGLSPVKAEPAHWAFRSLRRPAVPEVKTSGWVRNPVDSFVLARLEAEKLQPSPPASKAALIRRVSLDLIGLPPTPDEVAAFVADPSPDAYERLVDRLLRSPHYGEKWGRQWLDLARYSDSDGYRQDDFRRAAWRYRQWVIEAINRDQPFDQFTIDQIAGDLEPGSTVEQKVATGFHRNTPSNREGGVDVEQARFEQVVNRINTVGTVWLGLSVGCAQCHDHKYDPISQKEYYQLLAFFNDAEEVNIDAPLPGEMGPYLQAVEGYRKARRELLEKYHVPELQRAWEARLLEAAAHPGKWQEWDKAFGTVCLADSQPVYGVGERILRMPPEKRTEKEASYLNDGFTRYYSQVVPEKVYKEELKFPELRKKLEELDASFPALSEAQTIATEPSPRPTHVHIRGEFKQPGAVVQPGTPSSLHKFPTGGEAPRLRLARWLVSPENPLTPRVTVNRLWQELFERGIVPSSDNFGNQGDRPSHPELLDWLACELRDRGWSMKHVVRTIVLSATYRQSSVVPDALRTRDPNNALLARQSRFRLPAELIRDSALLVSGLLDTTVGGKSVRPVRPESSNSPRYKWVPNQGAERYRRGMYIQFQRMSQYPFMGTFDVPDGYNPVCRRGRSNTALQALNLLNDPVFFEAALALAVRLLTESQGGVEERLDRAFRLCLSRPPAAAERDALASVLHRQEELLAQSPDLVRSTLPVGLSNIGPVEGAAWVGIARVLLNTYEFITRE
jgi:hypothetical protein